MPFLCLFSEKCQKNNKKIDNVKNCAEVIKNQALRMVPRGRIELPTQGFSVLCSTDWAIWAFTFT